MRARLALTGALLCLAGAAAAAPAQGGFAIEDFDGGAFADPAEGGAAVNQAGARPFEAKAGVSFATKPAPPGYPPEVPVVPDEDIREALVTLPPGLLGDPTAAPACATGDFAKEGELGEGCPKDTRVGTSSSQIGDLTTFVDAPVYNLVPDFGRAAKLGFLAAGVRIILDAYLSPLPPYNAIVRAPDTPQIKLIFSSEVALWGIPAAQNGSAAEGAGLAPFLSLPTSCRGPILTAIEATSWQGSADRASFFSHPLGEPAVPLPIEGCEALGAGFEPTLAARPSTEVADSPTGLEVDLEVPQPEACQAGPPPDCGLATAHLKDAAVTLPEGLALNPAAANGLDACAEDEIDLGGPDPADCPDASKLATVEVQTPLLDHEVTGAAYLATPRRNPFGSLLALYIALEDPRTGTVVKLAGKVSADRRSGRLTARFADNPQVPFEHFALHFKRGAHAPLRTPLACDRYAVASALTPHSAPASGPPVTAADEWRIAKAPGSGDCPRSAAAVPAAAAFEAGAAAPLAAAQTPFVLHLRREEGSQALGALHVSPPEGLVASLAGVPYCPEAALAAARKRSGAAERDRPSCPAASRVGSVWAAAGAGPDPFWAPGTAYLAGPHEGAPLSLAILAPALAGPFDLGTVVVRTAIHIDPRGARIVAISDPVPEILEGIPLDLRAVQVSLDRPGFARTGTSCDPFEVRGLLIGALGARAPLADRYQLGECGRLGFGPRVALRLFGKTRRGAYQGLEAVVRPRAGDANIARSVVRMPRSAFLAQEHIRTVCTRVQFRASACPPGSVYGEAIAYSPLLGHPLQGDVYLRSSDNKLPDLVADLKGPAQQPIRIELVGKTDSAKGALRNTFEVVPDAPVSYFRLRLFGGAKGLIVNSRNICGHPNRATVALRAHNGRAAVLRPRLANARCKKRAGRR